LNFLLPFCFKTKVKKANNRKTACSIWTFKVYDDIGF
jgi:hypothetical protein